MRPSPLFLFIAVTLAAPVCDQPILLIPPLLFTLTNAGHVVLDGASRVLQSLRTALVNCLITVETATAADTRKVDEQVRLH